MSDLDDFVDWVSQQLDAQIAQREEAVVQGQCQSIEVYRSITGTLHGLREAKHLLNTAKKRFGEENESQQEDVQSVSH